MVESVKMVIAVRKDLDLGKGKMAAQVAHAAVSCALKAEKEDKKMFKEWVRTGQKKVVIKLANLEELMKLQREASLRGFTNYIITDAGLTQIAPGTVTCLGLGPADEGEIDSLTGEYPLF